MAKQILSGCKITKATPTEIVIKCEPTGGRKEMKEIIIEQEGEDVVINQ